MNARNLLYIKPFNPRRAVAFADDKMRTKAFLGSRGIPVARLYARIENRRQLQQFDFSSLPDKCALKPNYGFGGEGIIILTGRNKQGQFLDTHKQPIAWDDLHAHIEDILDGRFSVNGLPDMAFFEKLLVPHAGLAHFRPQGLPDIRIVVFNLVPVMAQLRIPTAESNGKANLHMGGIGIGIDIAKGVTTHAVRYGRVIRELPHGAPTAGIAIPFWEEMLLVASRIQHVTNIGYLAVDLTLDQDQGPMLLEVNARAGLAVQIANLAPLRARLERVQGIRVSSPEKGVRIAQELFGEKVRRPDASDDRPVLGLMETFQATGAGVHIDVPCRIAPEADRSVFAPELLRSLQQEGAAQSTGDDDIYVVKGALGGRKIQAAVRAGDPGHPTLRAIIGRRDLGGFLIDPQKSETSTRVRARLKDDLRAVDRFLGQADRTLLLLKYVKPINLREERMKAERDPNYAPLFHYRPLPDDVETLEQRILTLTADESPLGTLLDRKRRDILARISLLRARGDARRFTEASQSLFGSPTSVLIASARDVLATQTACAVEREPFLDAEQAADRFRDVLQEYGLTEWEVSVRTSLVADCTVGGRTLYVRAGARFSPAHIDGLIAHEIEAHMLTAENAARQPYALFRIGFASYLDTQEGLAVISQERVLPPHHEKRLGPARSLLGVAHALGHGFADVRRYLEHELGYRPDKALSKAIELKRGIGDTSEPGAFTKGIVYLRGARAIEQFTASGGDLKRLYIGRIALEDLELAEKIPGIVPPTVLPKWLRDHR